MIYSIQFVRHFRVEVIRTLFVRVCMQANNKEPIVALHHWARVLVIHRWIHRKKDSNGESGSML